MGTTPDFDEWAAARGHSLLRLAYVLTGSRHDAEAIVQEALSRALPRWSRISHLDDPDAYVRRMVVNAHVSSWRRFRRHETSTSTLVAGVASTGIAIEVRDVLWEGCRALPSDERTAIVLRFYEDLDHHDIAALTGVREGTVRSRVSRGVATLREGLGSEMTDVEQRLHDGLAQGAEEAPAPSDLARGARARLRRRRATMARTASCAAVAAAVTALIPAGFLLVGGDDDADRQAPVSPPAPSVVTERPTTNDVTARAEAPATIFWSGITFEVPAQWRRGATTAWCSRRDDPAEVTPRIAFPGDLAAGGSDCTPTSGYGVIMGSAAEIEPADVSRRVQRYDASADAVARFPDDAWLYSWYDEESVITVVTPDPGLTHRIARSISRVELDANGCAAAYDEGALPTAVEARGVGASLCRYAAAGQLEDSQRLTARETERALDSITAAPARPSGGECVQETGWRVTLTPAGVAPYLGQYGTQGLGSCQDGLESTVPSPFAFVELTPEILSALGLDDLPVE